MGIFKKKDKKGAFELTNGRQSRLEDSREYSLTENIIGKAEIRDAMQVLLEYKRCKANLERRIISNEQWWKLRHWDEFRKKDADANKIEPTSGWLLNCILSKHADAMDSFPEGNFLPRESGDKDEAKRLSSIIPCVLDQNDFEETYSNVWWYKLKNGTGVYSVTWDGKKHNGLGDISINKVDLINLYWQSGITDIQQSKNVFHISLCDNDMLESRYPELKGKLSNASITVNSYIYDDTVDTTNKSAVIDWYYRREVDNKTVLHFCKFVNDEVLFATENDPQYYDGWYADSKYPFVFDVLFPEEGTPTGFGYIDICKDPQKQIDLLNQGILQNALMGSTPRYFIRDDGNVNEKEFADFTKPLVHVSGNLGEDSIRQMPVASLPGIYVSILNNKIEELKETSGNRDVANGGTQSGVTAASAIAAMQEQSGKLSRDMIKASYRTHKNILVMCLERIRQFYDLPRQFRIIGQNGAEEYISFNNGGVLPKAQGNDFDVESGYRIPEFDIEVSSQKASPYNKMAQNELALQFFSLGFFNPQMADQALAVLDMMDFSRKETIMQKVSQNGTMYQQLMTMQQQMSQMSQIIDSQMGTSLSAGINGENTHQQRGAPPVDLPEQDTSGNLIPKEHAGVRKSRERSAESTQPR